MLSKNDIAEFFHTSNKSAAKLLKSFKKDGLVELHEKDIIVRDHNNLREISRRG